MFGKFFKKHPEFSLYFLASLFVGAVVAFYFFGIVLLASKLNRAIDVETVKDAGVVTSFDIEGAKALDLKGLVK